jgi:hypothetical protein
MIKQGESLGDPAGCSRVNLLRLPHVNQTDGLCTPPKQAFSQRMRRFFGFNCTRLYWRIIHTGISVFRFQ